MRTAVKPEDQSSVLADWQGAHAEIWIFDLTFRRLSLLLTKTDVDEILYVGGVGCQHITGPFRWDNAQLSITKSDNRESNVTGNALARLADQIAGFELLCHSVGLVRGLRSDIVYSFGENFLSDSSPL